MEHSQTVRSTFRTGALDKQEVAEDYEYVSDDESQMICGEQLSARNGVVVRQVEEAQQQGLFYPLA